MRLSAHPHGQIRYEDVLFLTFGGGGVISRPRERDDGRSGLYPSVPFFSIAEIRALNN